MASWMRNKCNLAWMLEKEGDVISWADGHKNDFLIGQHSLTCWSNGSLVAHSASCLNIKEVG